MVSMCSVVLQFNELFFFLFINKWMNNSELTSFPGGPTGPIIPTGPGGPCRKRINISYDNKKYSDFFKLKLH